MDRLSAEQLLPIGYVPNNWASGRASQLLIPQKLADEMRNLRMREEAKAEEEETRERLDREEKERRRQHETSDRVSNILNRYDNSCPGGHQVFELGALRSAWENGWSKQDADRRARAQDWFLAAARFSGRRFVPNIAAPKLRRIQKQLDIQFPHFKEITSHLCAELMLAMVSAQSSFRVSPILLHGGPGIGKTTYAMALANALGVGSQVISAGGSQGSFDICGTSAHWSNASVGKVFSLLAHTDSAAAVLVIDEIDKINGDERYSPIPVLLDLLEVQSARRFMDEALGMRFDASKLIVVATANHIESIPAPLLSRLHPVCLSSPTALEKRKIAERMLQDLKRGLGRKLSCDPAMLDELSNSSGDLREMARNLRFTVGQVLVKGKRNVSVSDLVRNKAQVKGSIGFLN